MEATTESISTIEEGGSLRPTSSSPIAPCQGMAVGRSCSTAIKRVDPGLGVALKGLLARPRVLCVLDRHDERARYGMVVLFHSETRPDSGFRGSARPSNGLRPEAGCARSAAGPRGQPLCRPPVPQEPPREHVPPSRPKQVSRRLEAAGWVPRGLRPVARCRMRTRPNSPPGRKGLRGPSTAPRRSEARRRTPMRGSAYSGAWAKERCYTGRFPRRGLRPVALSRFRPPALEEPLTMPRSPNEPSPHQALPNNPHVAAWIEECARLTKPDRIIWCDGRTKSVVV